jgi:molybdenum cofactor cytidylyltransferase
VIAGLDVTVAHNPEFALGIAASLGAGLGALPKEIDGAIVVLGDMPEITAAHLDRLIAAFAPKEGRAIVVPVRHGKRGNPVLWSSELFAEMRAIEGDVGAKHLMGEYADQVVEVDLESDAVLIDVDTPEALAKVRGR